MDSYDNFYFLDSENISIPLLVKYLKKGFKIKRKSALILFFNKTVSLKLDDIEYLEKKFKLVIREELNHFKSDALDFYLVSSVSFLAGKYKNKNFNILSNDKGFIASLSFLKHYAPENKYTILNEEVMKLYLSSIQSNNKIKTKLNLTEQKLYDFVLDRLQNAGNKEMRYSKILSENDFNNLVLDLTNLIIEINLRNKEDLKKNMVSLSEGRKKVVRKYKLPINSLRQLVLDGYKMLQKV